MGVFVLSFDLTSLFCMILFVIFQFFSVLLYLTVWERVLLDFFTVSKNMVWCFYYFSSSLFTHFSLIYPSVEAGLQVLTQSINLFEGQLPPKGTEPVPFRIFTYK